jgi:hypothetical protein
MDIFNNNSATEYPSGILHDRRGGENVAAFIKTCSLYSQVFFLILPPLPVVLPQAIPHKIELLTPAIIHTGLS